MIRMLLFYLKLAVAVFIAVKIADNRGPMTVRWGEYVVDTDSGIVLVIFIAVLLIFAGIYHLWRRFIDIPKVITEYREERKRIDGFNAVTKGFLALAAGDAAAAARNAEKAEKLLSDATLTLLLKAQSAYLNGNPAVAREIFIKLAAGKEGAFFGIRGLLAQAFNIGNGREALELTRKAYKLEPKRPWVVFLLIELEILHRNWKEAHTLLKKAVKIGTFDEKTSAQWHCAAYLGEAAELPKSEDTKIYMSLVYRAYKVCNDFPPAVSAYSKGLFHTGKRKKSLSVLIDAILRVPHPVLLREYVHMYRNVRGCMPSIKDIENVTSKYPRDTERLIILGKTALENNLYGLARSYLTGAIENGADKRAYVLLAQLENKDIPENLPEEAGWFCGITGVKFNEWQAFNPHNGAFNTLVWGIASERAEKSLSLPVRFPRGNIMPPDFITG